MKGIIFSSALLFLVTVSSCSKYESIRGEGRTITETRAVPAFTGLETHYDIRANITYGATQQVSVTGYENLLGILETEVKDGVLRLKYSNRYNSIRNSNVVVNITLPSLVSAVIHGSNNIEATGFRGGAQFEGRIHGSGDIRITNSNYELARLLIYGSGRIDAQGLQVKRTDAGIYGSGHVSVSVSDRLDAKIYGSGNVNYWGNPVVQTEVQGSGRVIKR